MQSNAVPNAQHAEHTQHSAHKPDAPSIDPGIFCLVMLARYHVRPEQSLKPCGVRL
jgi:subfamily B ATP-binding cassette protein HlyB/CyaB